MKTILEVTFKVQIWRSTERIVSIVETDRGFIPLVGTHEASMDTLQLELQRRWCEPWRYHYDSIQAKSLRAYDSVEASLRHADRIIDRYSSLPKQDWRYADTQHITVWVGVFPRGIKPGIES